MKSLLLLAPLLLAGAAAKQLAAPAEVPATYAALVPSLAASAAPARVPAPARPAAAASVTDVVQAANAFLATLTAAQVSTVTVAYNSTNVKKWSNLPCGLTCREGLQLSTLTAAQQAAALAVVQTATGTVSGDGYNETQQIRAADDNLGTLRTGYGSGIYFLAFVGTPSTTGTWQLQYGGHHLATNITFGNGAVTGATPQFEGVEPLTFTTANANVLPAGTACAPLANEAAGLLNLLNGLTTAQKATAKLSQSFSDVLLGPGQDGNFPATKVGLPVSSLSASQQALVLEAMRPWVQDADDATAASLLATYQSQLAGTYVAYSGTGLLTTSGDYVRIDGPSVWIEFVCQNGVVYNTQIHYHSIWRDHLRDYGGNYYVTATKAAAAAAVFGVYPNPIANGQNLRVQLAAPAAGVTCTLRSMLGQTVATRTFSGQEAEVPTAGLVPGVYLLSVQLAGQAPVARRVVVN